MTATKRRRLADLYLTGREVALNDDSGGEAVLIWLRKLNAIEIETTGRKASAVRSRLLIAGRDHGSDEWNETYSDLHELSLETLQDIVLSDEDNRAAQEADAEIGFQDEWKDKDYLQGLRDSWFSVEDQTAGLKFVYESGDEANDRYDEAVQVFAELQRFDKLVQDEVQKRRAQSRYNIQSETIEELREQATDRTIALKADQAFLQEYRRCQVFFGARDPEHHDKPYFSQRREVDELAPQVIGRLVQEFEALMLDVSEGKDSPPTLDSLPPSGQPGEGETADSSGLVSAGQ